MIKAFYGNLKGVVALLLMLLSTAFHFVLIIALTLFKVLPIPPLQRIMTKLLIAVATNWVRFNSALFDLFHEIEWEITGDLDLKKNDWYFVTCNHQSWSDIPICQKLMVNRIPMLKFFLKQELIWVPILGICWWALDFPFMKRYTPAEIKKNPKLAGKDLETTRKACEKFKTTPVSVFNFVEGTRLTEAKHQQQASPYRNLLKPKAGGAAFVLGSMGTQMHTMLDISIVYAGGAKGVWQLFNGEVQRVLLDVRKIEIPKEFLGRDYTTDDEFKRDFQQWLAQRWLEKDARIEAMKQRAEAV